jgi:hypothetical protein
MSLELRAGTTADVDGLLALWAGGYRRQDEWRRWVKKLG